MIILRAICYKDQPREECICHFPEVFASSPPIGLVWPNLAMKKEKGYTPKERFALHGGHF